MSRARAMAVLLVLAAPVLAALGPAALGPGAALAQTGTDADTGAGGELDTTIQILEVRPTDGGVDLVVAIPTTIGALAPTADNFGVLDGDRPAEISVSRVDEAVDVMIAIDTSQSMAGDPITAAKRAASAFVENLDPSARIGLVGFGETATVHREPGADHQAVLAEVAGLDPSGDTALWDGLVASAGLLGGATEPYVVILSDGSNTAGSTDEAEAVAALRSVGARLYAVGIQSPETDLAALEGAVDQVGGQYFDIADVADLEALYTDIAGRLDNRYEITFPSTRTDRRELTVSVAVGDGSVATASIALGGVAPPAAGGSGTGNDPGGAAPGPLAPSPVLNVGEGDRLGVVTGPGPDLLASGAAIWVGAAAFFAAFAIFGVLMTAPAAVTRFPSAAAGADRVAGWRSRVGGFADRLVAARDEEGALDEALDTAGLDLRPGEFIVLAVASTAVAGLVVSAVTGPAVGVVAVPLTTLAFVAYLRGRIGRRRRQFADQLGDTLAILIGGLRAGRGIGQAIELVSQEAGSPTREQFGRVVFEARIGRDMVESLAGVADRMRNRELEWVARAIDINRELGGDLIETMGKVTETIRDRRRVDRQVQALSAEGRASGWLMLALPPIMFLFLLWRTPDSASLLFTNSTGRLLLGLGLVGMVAGYFWIRRLVDLEY